MRFRLLILAAALAWDRFLGEPPQRVHPVVGIGKLIDAITTRGLRGEPEGDRRRGLAMAMALPSAVFGISALVMNALKRAGPIPEIIGGAFLLKSTFAISSMQNESRQIAQGLEADNLGLARDGLSRIVSRDVAGYDERQVASATISSISENVTDSAVGPLLAYGAFGVPGAAAYRAVNTLDAMVGYRDHRKNFGEASAKLDDAVNWIPARVAGASVVASAAAHGMNPRAAAATMLEQHSRTPSPNGGWPIGATAGALGVEVEKAGHYRLGPENAPARVPDIERSLKLYTGAAAIGAAIAAGLILARR